jgi:OmpA-OmpF porin, OOP family
VHRQFWSYLQAALPVSGRVLLDAALPLVLFQSGSRPVADLAGVSSLAVGDLRLGARVPLPLPFRLAAGLDVWAPTGSRDAFSSDGAFRAQPQVSLSGDVGRLAYGGSASLITRPGRELGFAHVGTALGYGAAVAYRWGALRVGPEFFARTRLDGTTSSPMEVLLGGRWRRGALDLGLAAGTGLNRAPGAAPLRVLFQAAFTPSPGPGAALAAAPPPAIAEPAVPPPPPTPPPPQAAPEPPARPVPEPSPAPVAPPPPLAEKKGDRIELRQQVEFDKDRDAIRPESESLLREVARVLLEHPEILRLRIEGHTDSAGSKRHNLGLSERRAAAVKRWLVERGGIDRARLRSYGYGSTRPVADNGTAAGRSKNRRVALVVEE